MNRYQMTFWNPLKKEVILNEDGMVNDTQMLLMKEANFTTIFLWYDIETNKKVLSACEKYNLRATVGDSRLDEAIRKVDDREKLLMSVVNDYKDYPALYDYHIFDEPNAESFDSLKDVVATLKRLDPNHPGYINLFPNYATPAQLGISTYDEYIHKFVQTVNPAVVSYDHYHFMNLDSEMKKIDFSNERDSMIYENAFLNSQRAGFFDNLESIRNVAQMYDKPFENIVLMTAHGPYRYLTEPELRFEAFQSLAYGCTILSWFVYGEWNDPNWNPYGAMIENRQPTEHYYMGKKVADDFLNLGKAIGQRKSIDIFHGTECEHKTKLFHPLDKVKHFCGNATIGLFEDDYFVIASKNFCKAIEVELEYKGTVEVFDRNENKWHLSKGTMFTIPAGDCILGRII